MSVRGAGSDREKASDGNCVDGGMFPLSTA